jgi:hypothetical protein
MSLGDEPHFKIPSSELADWLESQSADRWWNVDGDPLLTGRLSLPCPADELAAELRRINRTLLVRDRRPDPLGHGEGIGARELDALSTRLGDSLQTNGARPTWTNDRLFFLNWEGQEGEWLLVEDQETTEQSRQDAATSQPARK